MIVLVLESVMPAPCVLVLGVHVKWRLLQVGPKYFWDIAERVL
jgi:hypothetical protein